MMFPSNTISGLLVSLVMVCVHGGKVEKYRVMTLNAALVEASIEPQNPSIPNNRMGRRDAIIDYLNTRSNDDIVCLQEVSFGQDVERIVEGVNTTFQYSFSGLHLPDGTLPPQNNGGFSPSCVTPYLFPFLNCSGTNGCFTSNLTSIINVYQCLVSNCPAQFFAFIGSSDEKCLTCLLTNSPDDFLSRCVIPSSALWNINKLGLVLLSKQPLFNTSPVEFFPNVTTLKVGGYLKAEVGYNNLTVGCVHATTTTFNVPPLNPEFANFSQQNKAEMEMIVDTFNCSKPLILAGDFNAGPGNNYLDPLEEENYKILAHTFETKLVNKGTFTSTNLYNEGQGDFSWALDHVFVNGNAKILKAKVESSGKTSFGPEKFPLSDHEMVKAVIKVYISK